MLKNKQNPLRYMTNGSENPKKYFLMRFDPIAGVCTIAIGQRIYLYDNFSWEFSVSLTPFYHG